MAASSMQVQAILGNPVRSGRVTHYFPAVQAPGLRKQVRMPVGCKAEMKDRQEPPTEPVTTPPQPQPTPAPKVSTKFSDVLAFSGPGPERINGRLAMVGFVAAMAVELSKGEDVFTQISNGGVTWFLGASVLLSLASLIPLFRGVSVESKSQGLMTSDAELWNGRFAMLGLVALAFTEFVKGGALV
uniref:Early light-induced protein n=1 Tax=Rhizophora mucronata TaxID=61149 RepID=A0A2P2PIA1_RHIMU